MRSFGRWRTLEEENGRGKHRVVVWATGGIGSIAIRAIQQRPNLDLVGVWVHSPEKDGMDAGELANGEPIGLAVTTDADALIALKPDCVIYAASGPERDAGAIPDYVKLLSAGLNVVTTSTTRLVNPHAYEPAEWRDQLVDRGEGRPGVAVRLGHRTRLRRRLPAAGPVDACRHRSRRSTPTRSASTTTTACPTS